MNKPTTVTPEDVKLQGYVASHTVKTLCALALVWLILRPLIAAMWHAFPLLSLALGVCALSSIVHACGWLLIVAEAWHKARGSRS